MEINAISTILFAAIVLGIVGYYAIQRSVKKRHLAKRGVQQ